MGLVRQGVSVPLVLNPPPGSPSEDVLIISGFGQMSAPDGAIFTDNIYANYATMGNAKVQIQNASALNSGQNIIDWDGFISPSGVLGASITPASGTVYQNTAESPSPWNGNTVYIPATYLLAFENTGTLTGTIQLALGSTTPPADFGPAFTVGADQTIVVPLRVPPQWYWSVTQSGTLAPEILEASVLLGA